MSPFRSYRDDSDPSPFIGVLRKMSFNADQMNKLNGGVQRLRRTTPDGEVTLMRVGDVEYVDIIPVGYTVDRIGMFLHYPCTESGVYPQSKFIVADINDKNEFVVKSETILELNTHFRSLWVYGQERPPVDISWSAEKQAFVMFHYWMPPTIAGEDCDADVSLINSRGQFGTPRRLASVNPSETFELIGVDPYPNEKYYLRFNRSSTSTYFLMVLNKSLVPIPVDFEGNAVIEIICPFTYPAGMIRFSDGTFLWWQSTDDGVSTFKHVGNTIVTTQLLSDTSVRVLAVAECGDKLLYSAIVNQLTVQQAQDQHQGDMHPLCELRLCPDKMKPDIYTVIKTADRVAVMYNYGDEAILPGFITCTFSKIYYSKTKKLIFVFQPHEDILLNPDMYPSDVVTKFARVYVFDLEGNEIYAKEFTDSKSGMYCFFTDVKLRNK